MGVMGVAGAHSCPCWRSLTETGSIFFACLESLSEHFYFFSFPLRVPRSPTLPRLLRDQIQTPPTCSLPRSRSGLP